MRKDMRGYLMKRRIIKIIKGKYFKIIFLFGVCLLYTTWNRLPSRNKLPPLNMTYVVVHLDFKRTPLRLDYVQNLLKTLKDHGANGLLMEYEDMFPYEGNLVNLSATDCYNRHELKQFLSEAKMLGFEIIPLVQTFGHMEYALKLGEFAHLREDRNHTDSICPSKAESRTLIMDILEQVIHFHNNITPLKYIHIGCDEVYHMGKCADCIKRNLSVSRIYLNHVTSIYKMVKTLSKDTKILMWDDMLRTISPNRWKHDYHTPVEPVYWKYEPYFEIRHSSLLMYHKTFSDIWIATAFKGADGSKSVLPNLRNRFLNHYTWLDIINNYKFGGEKHVYNFKGIILTGWSRYNHYESSCDLLPASVPSLIVNLLLIKKFKSGKIDSVDMNPIKLYRKYIEKELKDALECEITEVQFKESDTDSEADVDNLYLDVCSFEGSILYNTLKAFLNLNITITNSDNQTVPSPKHSRKDWCEYMKSSIKFIGNEMTENMKEFYKAGFISHYVFEKIFALKVALKYCYY